MSDELKDAMNHIAEMEQRLAALGIPAERIDEALGVFLRYQDVAEDIEKARDRQFYDDAYVLGAEVKAAGKVTQIAQFLRRFAEHVASHTLDLKDQHRSVEAIVDRIPLMSKGNAEFDGKYEEGDE